MTSKLLRMLVIADNDDAVQDAGDDPADVLISCGDLYDVTIERAAHRCQATTVLAVKGNHDSNGPFPLPAVDLHLNVHVVGGVRFGGFAGSWRYKPRGHHLFDQDEVTTLLSNFPPVDVFVSHNSPRGIHDRDDGVHLGFEAYIPYIETARPRLFIHGHQHVNRVTIIGSTTVVGVYGSHWLTLEP